MSKQRLKSSDPEGHWENFTLLEFPLVNDILKTRYPGETVNDPRLYVTRSGKITQSPLKRIRKRKENLTKQQVGYRDCGNTEVFTPEYNQTQQVFLTYFMYFYM